MTVERIVELVRLRAKPMERDEVEELAGELEVLADELRQDAANREVDRREAADEADRRRFDALNRRN